MNTPSNPVSVLNAVSQAIERVKQVLFRPFDLTRWLAIGFSAWLATLGEGGGGGGNYGWHGDGRNGLRAEWQNAVDYVRDNLAWIVPLAIVVTLIIVALALLILWLSSRGRFMFLHNVATNRAEVVLPWHHYRAHGNSLFLFRVVLALCGFVLIVPFLIALGWAVIRMVNQEAIIAGPFLVAAGTGTAALGLGLAFALIEKLTKDFVVPIMWLRTPSCRTAWGEFYPLLTANLGGFVLYILFHILLSIAVAFAIMAVVLITCCLAGCLFAIPYLGTVFLLPVFVFLRSFSLCYFAQYGTTYDVFQTAGSPVTPANPLP